MLMLEINGKLYVLLGTYMYRMLFRLKYIFVYIKASKSL